MEQFKIMDNEGNPHIIHIGWNRLLSNDEFGIFVHCSSKKIECNYFYRMRAFSMALKKVFGHDRLVRV